jgi:hypothetical protein
VESVRDLKENFYLWVKTQKKYISMAELQFLPWLIKETKRNC